MTVRREKEADEEVHDGFVEFGNEAVSDLFAVFLSAGYGSQEAEGEQKEVEEPFHGSVFN